MLYSFCSLADCADGPYPLAGVIRDSEGNLYGTTINSAVDGGDGVVYKVDTSGSETVLYSFCPMASCADGRYPFAGVIRDKAGNLYGAASSGGRNDNAGVVFKLKP